MTRAALVALVAGAVVAGVSAHDVWFSHGPGFLAPDVVLQRVIDLTALATGGCALLALVRRAAGLERFAAVLGLLLAGGLMALLVGYGSGLDELDRGGVLAGIAAACGGAGGAVLVTGDGVLRRRGRAALVVAMLSLALAATALPPDWGPPEIEVIR